MRVWLSRVSPAFTDNVAWIEDGGMLLTLTADGKLLVYKESVHNLFVIKLLGEHIDNWEEL